MIEAILAGVPVLLDTGAIAAIPFLPDAARRGRRLIVTPHHGEFAKLENCDVGAVAFDPEHFARMAADAAASPWS